MDGRRVEQVSGWGKEDEMACHKVGIQIWKHIVASVARCWPFLGQPNKINAFLHINVGAKYIKLKIGFHKLNI